MSLVTVQCANILDEDSFHGEFQRVFGFPEFYGRNMSAWIDCMSSVGDLAAGMSEIHCEPGAVIALYLEGLATSRRAVPTCSTS